MTEFQKLGPVTRYESAGGKHWMECQLSVVVATDNPDALARNGGRIGSTQWTYTASWGCGALPFDAPFADLAWHWIESRKPHLVSGPALAGF